MKNILNDLGFHQISIAVYLRAPVEIANSLYSTAIQCGATIASPPGPDQEYWKNLCNHRNTLMRFRSQFGLDAIILRIYSKAELVNGSIIDDFAEAIGLPFSTDRYVIPARENESINIIGLEILRRINKDIPVFGDDKRPNQIRGNISSYVSKHLSDGDKYAMPTELCQQYEEAFRESNEWVRSEYFPDRQALFGATQVKVNMESSVQSYELDQIARLISAIWIDKSRDLVKFYDSENGKSYQIAKIIWRQKKKIIRIAGGLTSRWRRTEPTREK